MTVHVVPLGRTNKATCGVRQLSATVLAWQVRCGCFSILLSTQWLFLCDHGCFSPPSASHPAPSPPTPSNAHPPPIELIHDIDGVQKKVSENPAVLVKLAIKHWL